MSNLYEPVIGLEVHVELNTKTKMFCRSSADYFGKQPNTHTCPVCLGLPGALPFINQEAIKKCMMIGLALNCQVSDESRFERKNYFYPDLPKGYQVSQYRWPLCVGGWLLVVGSDGKEKKIRINRVHQEEDTAKLIHQFGTQNSKLKTQKNTLVDFNRSGVPLVEIVTEPDFSDPEEVRDYTKKIQQIVRALGVSNADMEKGDLRLEANVSVRKVGEKGLPNYRIELKNINSFSFMVKAIEFEIKRQSLALERGEKLSQETRGWDENKKETYLQRSKEEAHDYRYFPDPDLPELNVKDQISNIKSGMGELPEEKKQRFMKDFKISEEAARILVKDKKLAEYFEREIEGLEGLEIQPTEVANLLFRYKGRLNELSTGQLIQEISEKRTGVIEDEKQLEKIVEEVIRENPDSAADYQKGKLNAIQVLIGGVMRKTAGKADASKVKEVLEKILSS